MPFPHFKNTINTARLFPLLTLLALLVSSCSAGVTYWIPPSSPERIGLGQPVQDENGPHAQSIAALAALAIPAPAAILSQPDVFLKDLPAQNTTAVGMELVPVSITRTPTPQPEFKEASPSTAIPTFESTHPIDPAGATAIPGTMAVDSNSILYNAQAADTLQSIAVRFGVDPAEILSAEPIPETAYLTPGQLFVIPGRLASTTSSQRLIPDSDLVFSPSAAGFDPISFASQAGGRLGIQQEWLKSTGTVLASELILLVARENSINPRLLLSLLEYQSGWVYGRPQAQDQIDYPLGLKNPGKKGLYKQLRWAIDQLSIGYYAYREGRLTEIRFPDGAVARLAPDLNAGTAALQYYFAQLYQGQEWQDALDPETGFPALHVQMFGDPWQRAQLVEPLFPPGTEQPPLILPFERNYTWSFTGGPHGAWDSDGAYAALDFAPGGNGPGCLKSNAWAVASASGLVVRSGNGLVVLDLDGDGREETGWVLAYLHIASKHSIPVGTWVDTGDRLGHPSCEGGFATGTHVHIARKFNGEWISAYGPLSFNLGGWIAGYGEAAYKGTLIRDGAILKACTCSNFETFITRTENDP